MYFATSFGAPGTKCRCPSVLHFNPQSYLLFHLLWELLHSTVLCHFTEKFSESMLFPGRSVHEMTMIFLIPLGTSWEVGHSFLPLWTDFLPILHGQEEIAQWCWLSATERGCVMRHWWGEMMQWCHEGGICISWWNKRMNAKLSSSIIYWVLRSFHGLVCGSTFWDTWYLSVFPHYWIMLSFVHYSLPEFPQSVSRQVSLLCKEDRWKSTFLLLRISAAFLRGRKYALFFEQHADYLKSDHGMGRDRNTVCRKYNIQVGQPMQRLTLS